MLRTLEAEFDEISSTLNYVPPEPIGVVLYTNQTFVDITRVPAWVGALNDGRIRVPVEGISIVGRSTQGVIVFDTAAGERVVSVEHIPDENGDEEAVAE